MRFNITFKILDQRTPFRQATGFLRALLDSIRARLSDLNTGVNQVYDAFLTTAAGDDLDLWGEAFGAIRSAGETDTDYRARLLAILRAKRDTLTYKAIKDKVNADAGVVPAIEEIRDHVFVFPDTFGKVLGGNDAAFLVIVPDTADMDLCASAVQDVKCAGIEARIVVSVPTGYETKRRIS